MYQPHVLVDRRIELIIAYVNCQPVIADQYTREVLFWSRFGKILCRNIPFIAVYLAYKQNIECSLMAQNMRYE